MKNFGKNCVDSQIKRSSDNREKIDLCQKYDGTQIAERGESSFLYLRKVGALVLMPSVSKCRKVPEKKIQMRSKSQDLTFQRWKIVRFRHCN